MKRLLTTLIAVTTAAIVSLAQVPGPRLIVLNKEDATLAVVDPASGRIAGRVQTGSGPHEVTVSDDGKTAFVGNYGAQAPGSTISVIDLAGMKEVRRVDVSPLARPHGMFFNRGTVYFTAEASRVVARYDPAANRIDWMFGTGQAGTHMVWVAPDATKLYTCNIGSDTMSVIERGANAGA
jgi:DNA-binding beta-propeller fold protein YncE